VAPSVTDEGRVSTGAASAGGVEVEVAYAGPTSQRIIALRLPLGATAWQAVIESGIVGEFPEIDLETAVIGVFSRKLDGKRAPSPEDYVLKSRDRVEIYRPLQITPIEARKLRASKGRQR